MLSAKFHRLITVSSTGFHCEIGRLRPFRVSLVGDTRPVPSADSVAHLPVPNITIAADGQASGKAIWRRSTPSGRNPLQVLQAHVPVRRERPPDLVEKLVPAV